jgi:hypothetical protein
MQFNRLILIVVSQSYSKRNILLASDTTKRNILMGSDTQAQYFVSQ